VTLPQHMSLTQEHPTPAAIVEAAREVLGHIEIDPATTAEFNAATVKAERIFTKSLDGLVRQWGGGTVFLNPPGGTFTARRKSKDDPPVETTAADKIARDTWKTDSRAVAWWRKLISECAKPAPDDVTAAIFIGFTIEILRSSQGDGWISAMEFPFCVPRDRLCFAGDDPTHANVIVYIGPDVERFAAVFGKFGAVKL
jgi:hypothetical protein